MKAIIKPWHGLGDENASHYLGWSVIPEFRGRRNVIFSWFRTLQDRNPANPASAVRDFHNQNDMRKLFLSCYLGELLNRDEAALLGDFLKIRHNIDLKTVPVSLPIAPNVNLTGLVPISFNVRMFRFPRCVAQTPPVQVGAYYDLRFTLDDFRASAPMQ